MPEKKKVAVPKLRFPEFRDAGPWEVKRLGEVLTFQTGFPFSSKYFNEAEEGLRLIRNADLKSSDRVVFYSGPYDKIFIVNNGDILVGMDGDFSPSVWRNGKALLNQRVGRVFAKDGNNLAFLHYSLSVALKVIEQRTAQTTVKHLSHTTVEKTKWPIPIFSEQQKIADCLASLDDLIRAEGERLAALKEHKRGLMQQLFPAPGETTPRLRFPEFRDAGPWEMRTIEDVAERIAQGGTPKTSVTEYWNGDIPWITPAEMSDDAAHHYTGRTLRAISIEGLQDSSAELLPVNSVIVSSRAPIGYVTINKVEMATNQGCKGIVPKAEVYHEFLYFSLLIANRRLNDLGAGAGFKEISASTLKALQIPIPEYPEQQKIADCLSSLDDLITAQEARIEALKTHKRGLMQQLFPQEVG